MSDTTFVLVMAAIVVFACGIPAYFSFRDARYDARLWHDFVYGHKPLVCFRIGCSNPAVEGKVHCVDCIADLKRRGIKV